VVNFSMREPVNFSVDDHNLDASQVVVVDTVTQQVTATIPDVSQVHGVLAVPALKRVYASATGSNQIAVIDADTAKVIAQTAGGAYPDGLAYDPEDGRVFVSDEAGGTVTVVATQTNHTVATIDAGGEVGNTQYDSVSHRVFSAVQSRNQLIAIDPASNRIVARYDLANCKHAHGLALDTSARLAFIACDENATLLTFDLQTLHVTGQQTVGDQPDVLALDPGLHRLYVAAESGVLAVFTEQGTSLTKLGQAFLLSMPIPWRLTRKVTAFTCPWQTSMASQYCALWQRLRRPVSYRQAQDWQYNTTQALVCNCGGCQC
jgi:YVTN family beta-propeller protein